MEGNIGLHDGVAYMPIVIYLGKMFFDKFFRKAEMNETRIEHEQSSKLDQLLAAVNTLHTSVQVITSRLQNLEKLEEAVKSLLLDVATLKAKNAQRKR